MEEGLGLLEATALYPLFQWLEAWLGHRVVLVGHKEQARVVLVGHRALKGRARLRMYPKMGWGTGIQDRLRGGSMSRDDVEA